MKAIANKKPPRPWFHDRLKVSGYTIIVNRIGAISMSITAKLGLNPNNFVVVVYFLLLLSETPVCLLLSLLLLLNKLHSFNLLWKIKMFYYLYYIDGVVNRRRRFEGEPVSNNNQEENLSCR